jgi:hypothetical protein
VTISADEDSEVLVFDGHDLDRVYEVTPKLSLILDCLVGKVWRDFESPNPESFRTNFYHH